MIKLIDNAFNKKPLTVAVGAVISSGVAIANKPVMTLSRLVEKFSCLLAVFAILLTPLATYTFLNVQTRPEMISVAIELPQRKGIVTMWDPVDAEVGLGGPPDWYTDWEGEQKHYYDETFVFSNSRTYTVEEHVCLAKNIYFEARQESLKGQLLVALVTLERVKDSRWPDNICDVVYDHKQFSWYWDGLSDNPKNIAKIEEITVIVKAILHPETSLIDFTKNATHYHATYVEPKWAKSMIRLTQVGYHIAYREERRINASL